MKKAKCENCGATFTYKQLLEDGWSQAAAKEIINDINNKDATPLVCGDCLEGANQ